jgi:hypothetical protein
MTINDWLRKETDGNITYYGFAHPSAEEEDLRWSILKEEVDGTATTRKWANNDFATDKFWDDKEEYFVNPSGETITLISSGVTDHSNYYLPRFEARWDYVPGVTRYFLTLVEDGKIISPWNNSKLELTPDRNLVSRIDILKDKNYKVILVGKNGEGETKTEIQFDTKDEE